MPTFEIGLDDGRKLRIDADSQDAALAGAQHFLSNSGPQVSTGRAAGEGYLDTAGLGFRDEVYGLSKASGLPDWMGGFRAIPGAAELALEKYRGNKDLTSLVTGDQKGPFQRSYEKYRDEARQLQKAAEEQHPSAYLAGQLGGGVASAATMPAFRAAEGAGLVGRAAAAAKTGSYYGTLYGLGSGEGANDTLTQGLIGGATGGLIGGVASPVTDIASHVAGLGLAKGGEIYQWLRSEANPRFVDEEAVRRLGGAIGADVRAGQAPLTNADVAMAGRVGVPLVAGDLGGPQTMSLMRSAANTSPEARGAIEQFTKGPPGEVGGGRFGDQNQRAANFIRELTGGANATADLEGLKEAARASNRPAYRQAYEEGNRPIWSAELERLTGAPDVQQAIKSAIGTSQSRAVEEGFGAFNPGVTVTPDGRIRFSSPRGAPTYPNLQFWDSVQRDLGDAAQTAAGKEPDRFRVLGSLNRQLNAELDRLVPSFGEAREGAWRHFQAQDALEAGQNFATLSGRNSDYARDIARMSAPNRELFARGYASDVADKLLKLRDAESIDRAFLTSKSARERHAMALGPDRAQQLEAYLRLENIADRMRRELGNSTTARQWHELKLAFGGAGSAMIGNELFGSGDHEHSLSLGAAVGLATHFAAHRMTATEHALATRIGQLLVSNDPRISARAVQVISRSPGIMGALRAASRQDFGTGLARAATMGLQSQIQGPASNMVEGLQY